MFAKNSEFKEALHWLNQTSRFGMKLDLDNIQTLLEALDHPHQTLKVIHVAGTNGKGSTCAMLTSVLMKAGYKVGLYTSPHLISLRERIKVNGEWISEDDFVQGIHLLRAVVRKKGNLYPTYFELMTALAFDHFFKNRVDIVVLEAGMGGRLDSTNIAGSRVQIITNIDLEHTRYLGKTVAEIAHEKAGIIKPSSSVVTGTLGTALKVIEARARDLGCNLIRLGQEITYQFVDRSLEGQRVVISTKRDRYEVILKLLGTHQCENAALAIGALEAIKTEGFAVQKEDILEGLNEAQWAGRFEILKQSPIVILDAAHNPAAVQVLCRTWQDYFGTRKAELIFSALEDKDVESMAELLSKISEQVTLVELSNRRALKLNRLQEVWENYLPRDKVVTAKTSNVLQLIQGDDEKNRPILITGSIYLLGEILGARTPALAEQR